MAVDQKSVIKNPRSTVGTMTEIYDYLRLLFAKSGIRKCPNCSVVLTQQDENDLFQTLTEKYADENVQFLAPVVDGHKGEYRKELQEISKSGFSDIRIDGKILPLNPIPELEKTKLHQIEIPFPEIKLITSTRNEAFNYLKKHLSMAKELLKYCQVKHCRVIH